MGTVKGFWMLVGVLVAGCAVPGLEEGSTPIPEGKGQLVIRWTPEASRSPLGSTWAAANADVYEGILVGATENKFFDLPAGSGQTLSVDPGNYRVIVLAGIKRSSGSTVAFLVGSALAEAVTVTLGQRTPVNLTLKSIDMAWTTSGDAVWNRSLGLSVAGKTRNPRVGMSLAGTSTTKRPRFKSAELWNGYAEASLVSGTPDDWVAEATGTVPSGGSSVTVGLAGAGLQVQDLADVWTSLAGLARHSWYWPNRPDVTDTHPLVAVTEFTTTSSAPATGIDVDVVWE